ncbi:hypothetical protein LXL04_009483 [Taraxacum kok-saghyz]
MFVGRGWAGDGPGIGRGKAQNLKGRGFDSPHPLGMGMGMGTRSGTRKPANATTEKAEKQIDAISSDAWRPSESVPDGKVRLNPHVTVIFASPALRTENGDYESPLKGSEGNAITSSCKAKKKRNNQEAILTFTFLYIHLVNDLCSKNLKIKVKNINICRFWGLNCKQFVKFGDLIQKCHVDDLRAVNDILESIFGTEQEFKYEPTDKIRICQTDSTNI